ncbi:MAG: hypothetical protein JKX92_11105 [Porticoccaceae bacterium]|nr:hypothetical protein [Porticoccaceae bacterium]
MSRIFNYGLVFVLGIAFSAVALNRYRLVDYELQLSPNFRLADGSTYAGPVSDGQLSGRGELRWPNGAVYKGDFKEGVMDGQGVFEYADGSVYSGIFVMGLLEGRGSLTLPSGDSYTGQFEKDEMSGDGEYRTEAKDIYKGQFIKGQFTGKGTYTNNDGLEKTGEFSDWQLTGKGKVVDEVGNTWSGTYDYGTLTGQGEYKGVDGSHYQGEFEYGRYDGKGTLIDAQGNKFTGQFSWGVKNGEGIYWPAEPEGKTEEIQGTWANGQLIKNHSDPGFKTTKDLAELALYNQDALIEAQLSSLKQSDPEKINLYFLGIAGYGAEEVFRREVEFIKNKLDDELDTEGRSVLLVNSRTTVEELPLATYTSIDRTLSHLQTVMSSDDILLVYMTSHGSKKSGFNLNQKGVSLNSLDSVNLKALFDRRAMPWQVMVISACYSGALINDLAAETRMIITAASKDKKSFGCSDENEFTFFGRAYFKESLTSEGLFVKAFENAEGLVGEWENNEEFENSLPQIHKPEPILKHLDKWRLQRSSR